jgi:hypothetical protein
MAFPPEIAFTACGVLGGTIPTKPGPARRITPSTVISTSPFENLPNLFLRMEMLVDRGARVELVVAECHAGRIKTAASPARQPLDHRQLIGVNECHVQITYARL